MFTLGNILKWVYILKMSISLSLHIIYDLLYCIFLHVLKILFFVITLFVHFQYLDQCPNGQCYKSNSYSSSHLACILTIFKLNYSNFRAK